MKRVSVFLVNWIRGNLDPASAKETREEEGEMAEALVEKEGCNLSEEETRELAIGAIVVGKMEAEAWRK